MRSEETESPVLEMIGVGRRMDGTTILRNVDWTVESGQNWAVLGPNGSGKTTLARIAALRLHPTVGTVRILGAELGRIDIRPLLPRLGYAAAALAEQLRPELPADDVVMTAKNGALEPWWHEYAPADREGARHALARVDVDHLADHRFGSLSSGEKQRVLIARALMTQPDLLILDEPTAALDLGGREEFVAALDRLAAEPQPAPMVLITHHVDEIPRSFTHCLLMGGGESVFSGLLVDALTPDRLSKLFGLPLTVEQRNGRWNAWADR